MSKVITDIDLDDRELLGIIKDYEDRMRGLERVDNICTEAYKASLVRLRRDKRDPYFRSPADVVKSFKQTTLTLLDVYKI